MSSIVFDASGNVVRQSHNLRGILDIVEHKPGAWDYAANKPKGGTE